jgi:hypothetical protein
MGYQLKYLKLCYQLIRTWHLLSFRFRLSRLGRRNWTILLASIMAFRVRYWVWGFGLSWPLCIGIAAMLAGFGFSSLKMSFPKNTPMVIEIIYLAITACAIGLELCAILNSACCSVFGKDSKILINALYRPWQVFKR